MTAINFNFISNNVKGLKSSKKRIKLFEYFKSKPAPSGVLFAEETHSNKEIEHKWKDESNGQIFFSHGESNTCGVFIAFFGSKSVTITKEISDNNCRILVLQVKIDDEIYLLVNLYNSNTEPEQLETLHELQTILLKFDTNEYNHIIFSGDFNIFFNASLKTTGGNAKLKTGTVGKFLELKDKFDLCDIWRVKHPKTKTFTFRQKHFSGFIQRRLDYIFVLQNLQKKTRNVDILNAVSTDNSPVFCSLLNSMEIPKGPGIWKFNNSLIFDRNFVKEIKCFIHDTKKTLLTEDVFDKQSQWEILKYEIRKFPIRYSKVIAKEKRKKQYELESKLKILENSLSCDKNIEEYHKCKANLDEIYDIIAEELLMA